MEMRRLKHCGRRLLVSSVVLLLGVIAFSCCIAAEFKKVKAKDMKLDGSLCSLPRSSAAFGLGIASIVCLSIAQIVGTSTAATRLSSRGNASGKNKTVSIALLLLSWVSFGLAVILVGTGSSMNSRQAYGKGWMDGECYVVKDGVFIGAAALDVSTVIFILGLLSATTTRAVVAHGAGDHQEIRREGDRDQEQGK